MTAHGWKGKCSTFGVATVGSLYIWNVRTPHPARLTRICRASIIPLIAEKDASQPGSTLD